MGTHGHSGHIEIMVLIFDIQSNLEDVIRYYLQFLEKRLYVVFFERREAFRAKKMLFRSKRSVLVENEEEKSLFDMVK